MKYYYYKGAYTNIQLILLETDSDTRRTVLYSSVHYIKEGGSVFSGAEDKGPYNSIEELMADNFIDFL